MKINRYTDELNFITLFIRYTDNIYYNIISHFLLYTTSILCIASGAIELKIFKLKFNLHMTMCLMFIVT